MAEILHRAPVSVERRFVRRSLLAPRQAAAAPGHPGAAWRPKSLRSGAPPADSEGNDPGMTLSSGRSRAHHKPIHSLRFLDPRTLRSPTRGLERVEGAAPGTGTSTRAERKGDRRLAVSHSCGNPYGGGRRRVARASHRYEKPRRRLNICGEEFVTCARATTSTWGWPKGSGVTCALSPTPATWWRM